MSKRTTIGRIAPAAAALLAVLAATAGAGTYNRAPDRAVPAETMELGGETTPPVPPEALALSLEASAWALSGGMPDFGETDSADAALPADRVGLILAAPAEAVPEAVADVLPAGFVYPDLSGLESAGRGKVAVPPAEMAAFALAPAGVGRVLIGRPEGVDGWENATETAISYIRPHVNVQMILSLGRQGGGTGADGFEGSGFDPSARLAVSHRTRVHSAEVASKTSQFGHAPRPTPPAESQTAVAAGVDLGILPTFLAQMGMNVSLVVSRGEETGDLNLSLVGTSELPTDWSPGETPRDFPAGVAANPLQQPPVPGFGFVTRSVAGGGLPFEFPGFVFPEPPPFPIFPEPGPTPIFPEEPGDGNGDEPVIPEPATLMLMATGAIGAWLGRRRRSR